MRTQNKKNEEDGVMDTAGTTEDWMLALSLHRLGVAFNHMCNTFHLVKR